MGFKDFEHLNQALLAKQAWRLLEQPHSLWARIIKSIYFPNCSFLEAKKGRSPSQAWISILHGKETLVKEGRWLVGNGHSIKMTAHNWLASGEPLINESLSEDTTMHCILDDVNHRWDIEKIREMLPPVDLGKILQTPIKLSAGEDTLIWPHRESGSYSVKSGYRQIKNRATSLSHNPSTSYPPLSNLWNSIWSSSLP